MSSLNLRMKKLRSPRNIWKTFTSKLHAKIHKLHTPKSSIAKPQNPIFQILSVSPPYHRPRTAAVEPSHALTLRCCRRRRRRGRPLQKAKAAPVYVDELFGERELVVVDDGDGLVAKGRAGADEARGIDERAEELIARFRAELELQERLPA